MSLLNKAKTAALAVTGAVLVSSPVMASIDVSAEAGAFKTDFLAAASTIGAAFLAAGFGAIVWKWAKGMLFS